MIYKIQQDRAVSTNMSHAFYDLESGNKEPQSFIIHPEIEYRLKAEIVNYLKTPLGDPNQFMGLPIYRSYDVPKDEIHIF